MQQANITTISVHPMKICAWNVKRERILQQSEPLHPILASIVIPVHMGLLRGRPHAHYASPVNIEKMQANDLAIFVQLVNIVRGVVTYVRIVPIQIQTLTHTILVKVLA